MEYSRTTIVPVRISPEDAGGIALSRVVVREVALCELVEWIVGVTGKDSPRILEILARGTFVKSLSRLRWAPLDATAAMAEILSSLPDDLPDRPFEPDRVREALVVAGQRQIVIPGKVLCARRWFRPRGFLNAWMASDLLPQPRYERYDFGEKADRYRTAIPHAALPSFREVVEFLPSAGLRAALRPLSADALIAFLPRA